MNVATHTTPTPASTRLRPGHPPHQAALRRVSGATDCALDRLAASFPDGRSLSTASTGQRRALGCSQAQARRIVAAFELVRASDATARSTQAQSMRRPNDVWAFILKGRPDIVDLEVEQFLVVALNARQRPLDVFVAGQGTVAQVEVHPREVFTPLVRMRAHSCIVAHNHPSGDPSPSEADIELTRRLVDAGKLMGIPVLDHLVLAGDAFTSLASAGLMGDTLN